MPFKIAIQAYGSGQTAESDVVTSPFGTETASTSADGPKVWNGTEWVKATRKIWNGTLWNADAPTPPPPQIKTKDGWKPAKRKTFKDGQWKERDLIWTGKKWV